MGRVFANGLGDLGSIPGCVISKTLKMVLDTSLLKLSDIIYVSRVKWSNPGKGVVPTPTPWCSSYRKGSLLVTLPRQWSPSFFYFINSSITDIEYSPNYTAFGQPQTHQVRE